MVKTKKPLSNEERKELFPSKKEREKVMDTGDKAAGLPPLKNPPGKRQGPFRSPAVVRRQRYRSLSPTLRVSTAYDSHIQQKKNESNAEWIKRIQNKPMVSIQIKVPIFLSLCKNRRV